MPPGHRAFPHVHDALDLILILRAGTAVNFWWDEQGNRHEQVIKPGQHLFIPQGAPHASANIGPEMVVADEFRSSPVFGYDVRRLPELNDEVARRTAEILQAS